MNAKDIDEDNDEPWKNETFGHGGREQGEKVEQETTTGAAAGAAAATSTATRTTTTTTVTTRKEVLDDTVIEECMLMPFQENSGIDHTEDTTYDKNTEDLPIFEHSKSGDDEFIAQDLSLLSSELSCAEKHAFDEEHAKIISAKNEQLKEETEKEKETHLLVGKEEDFLPSKTQREGDVSRTDFNEEKVQIPLAKPPPYAAREVISGTPEKTTKRSQRDKKGPPAKRMTTRAASREHERNEMTGTATIANSTIDNRFDFQGGEKPSEEEFKECRTDRQRKALASWYINFNHLVLFKTKKGHCNVPQKYSIPELANWVNKQREEYKKFSKEEKSNMTQAKVDKLVSVGFKWAKPKGQENWDMHLEELRTYKEKYGHVDVPTKWEDNPALGRWVSSQRDLFKKGQLDSGRMEKLRKIGFNFSKQRQSPSRGTPSDQGSESKYSGSDFFEGSFGDSVTPNFDVRVDVHSVSGIAAADPYAKASTCDIAGDDEAEGMGLDNDSPDE